ncbi:MAG: hypothetical protein ACXVLQ_09350 [Bacteriovorax sp.]
MKIFNSAYLNLSLGFLAMGIGLFSSQSFASANLGRCDGKWSNCIVFASFDAKTGDGIMTDFYTNPSEQNNRPGFEAAGGKVVLPKGSNEVRFVQSNGDFFIIGSVNDGAQEDYARSLNIAGDVKMTSSPGQTVTYKLYRPAGVGTPGSLPVCQTHIETTYAVTFEKGNSRAVLKSVEDKLGNYSVITLGCPRTRK